MQGIIPGPPPGFHARKRRKGHEEDRASGTLALRARRRQGQRDAGGSAHEEDKAAGTAALRTWAFPRSAGVPPALSSLFLCILSIHVNNLFAGPGFLLCAGHAGKPARRKAAASYRTPRRASRAGACEHGYTGWAGFFRKSFHHKGTKGTKKTRPERDAGATGMKKTRPPGRRRYGRGHFLVAPASRRPCLLLSCASCPSM